MEIRGKVRYFTLIELLIVVAIIAILASLLLPALRNARSAGRKISCVNNLKQCAIGMSMYSQDWNDFYPAPYLDAGPDTDGVWLYNDWQYAISGYLYPGKDLRNARFMRPGTVFWCPSEVSPALNASSDPTREDINSYRYAMNDRITESGREYPKKINAADNPVTTCLLIESYGAGTNMDAWNFHNFNGNVPHGRRSNLLFMDMHISDASESDIPQLNSDIFWSGKN